MSRLNWLLTQNHWSGGGEGAKHYAMKQMNSLLASIQGDIHNYTFKDPAEATALLVGTLSLTSSVVLLLHSVVRVGGLNLQKAVGALKVWKGCFMGVDNANLGLHH